jgi:hypothetical protein
MCLDYSYAFRGLTLLACVFSWFNLLLLGLQDNNNNNNNKIILKKLKLKNNFFISYNFILRFTYKCYL